VPERGSDEYNHLPYAIKSYMEQHPDFPHESTADVFFDADQFRAYRSLGYTVTKRHFGMKEGDKLKSGKI
jgi:hypothetical protein